jgi:Tat protein translocase TatB subunit
MGPTELVMIVILALVIFGPRRLPEIMQYVGKAFRQIKELTDGVQSAVSKDIMQPISEELIKPMTEAKDSVVKGSVNFATETGTAAGKTESTETQQLNNAEGASVS